MKNDKSKNIIIALLVIIIIILGVLLGLGVTKKISFKETNYGDNNKQTEDIIKNYLNLLSEECENGCSKTISNGNKESILYVSSSEIKLDDTQILKFEVGPYSLPQVSVYNDIIITLQTASLSSSIIIYDFSGNIIKTIGIFKDEQGRIFNAYPSYSQTERFNVSNDGIISFAGTKHIQGAANTYIDNNGTTIDLCTQGETINDNEIVAGLFKMKYLGSYSFTDIEYISTKTTVKDIKSCN